MLPICVIVSSIACVLGVYLEYMIIIVEAVEYDTEPINKINISIHVWHVLERS